MQLRQRDFVASILVVFLGRITYTYNSRSESLIISLTPAFYTEFEATETRTLSDSKPYIIHTAKPVPFDVDGDGIIEALVVPSLSTSDNGDNAVKSHQWGLKVLDLKPLHNLSTQSNNFHPTALFSSKNIVDSDENSQTRVPLRITTGQIIFRKNSESNESSIVKDKDSTATDTTRNQHERLAKTLRGGLPSCFTVWSDGVITMHSVTTDWPAEKNTTKLSGGLRSKLELREIWRINPFLNSQGGKSESAEGRSPDEQLIDFEELDIIFDSNISIGEHGAIIVAARYRFAGARHKDTVMSYYAIDAFGGKLIWERSVKTAEEREKSKSSKIDEGATDATVETIGNDTTSEECLDSYRYWIMHPSTGALPHTFWDSKIEQGALSEDSRLIITHFDEYHHYNNDTSTKSKIKTLLYAQPNVALFHNRNGVDVISLSDGINLCHMSLFPRGLYADINDDGIIDHLQVVTDNWKPSSYRHITPNAISRDGVLHASDIFATKIIETVGGQLCHALLLSGIPAREELFSIPLCNNKSSGSGLSPNIHAAPPLLVETYDANTGRPRQDIVFALNSGTVKRYDSHGKQLWSLAPGGRQLSLWENNESIAAYLGRIEFKQPPFTHMLLASIKRPILISGSDNMSIISSGQGKILAHESFGQLSVGRPILSDMNGDGTTDILVIRAKSIQCYCVKIEQGRNILVNIMIFFLMVGIGVAATFQFYSENKCRSTDE